MGSSPVAYLQTRPTVLRQLHAMQTYSSNIHANACLSTNAGVDYQRRSSATRTDRICLFGGHELICKRERDRIVS